MKHVRGAELAEQGVSHDPAIRKQVLLPRGLVPRLTGFSRAVLRPGQEASEHRHPDMAEVFLVQAGQATVAIEGQPLSLATGDCLLVEPGERHHIANTGSGDLVLLYFGLEIDG